MSLTGSCRSAEQWREIQKCFEHSGQTQVAFYAVEGLALSTFTLRWRKHGSSRWRYHPRAASPSAPQVSALVTK